jgi:hypothetical protein
MSLFLIRIGSPQARLGAFHRDRVHRIIAFRDCSSNLIGVARKEGYDRLQDWLRERMMSIVKAIGPVIGIPWWRSRRLSC